ncbi:unnamed protein product [Linum trigynum]|uniref:Uncharacterized protein n=1 Tax=Linum trigynum TaxID=586398 RepID=A0AAV2F6X8_9ROSI
MPQLPFSSSPIVLGDDCSSPIRVSYSSLVSFVPDSQENLDRDYDFITSPIRVHEDLDLSLDIELLSASCVGDSVGCDWCPNSFPFDLDTLEKASLEVGRLVNLDHGDGQEAVEREIIAKAKEMHQRKLRTPGSKLDMEKYQLGPLDTPPSSPRKSKRKGGSSSKSGI